MENIIMLILGVFISVVGNCKYQRQYQHNFTLITGEK